MDDNDVISEKPRTQEEPRKMSMWFKLNDYPEEKVDGLSTGQYARIKRSNREALDFVQKRLLHILKDGEKLKLLFKSIDGVDFIRVLEPVDEFDGDDEMQTRLVPDIMCDQCRTCSKTDNSSGIYSDNVNQNSALKTTSHTDYRTRLEVFKRITDSSNTVNSAVNVNSQSRSSTRTSVDQPQLGTSKGTSVSQPDKSASPSDVSNVSLQRDDCDETSNITIGKSRACSAIWSHCKKVTENKVQYLLCGYCRQKFKYHGNTTNMMNHLSNMHPLFFNKMENRKSQERTISHVTKKPCTNSNNVKSSTFTPSIQSAFLRVKNFEAGGSKDDEITNTILFMFCVDHMPLSTVEKPGFRALMRKAFPLYKIPSRFTITTRLEQKYALMKNRIKQRLESLERYCITADNWSDRSNQTYMGVTVHFLNENDSVLQKLCLGCIPLYYNHTAEYLEDKMREIFTEFNIIIDKISIMLTDAEAAIKKATIGIVGAKRHLACLAHAISHVLPDAVGETPELKTLITKVKAIVTLIKRSNVAIAKLKQSQVDDASNENVKTLNDALTLINDCPTRWTSTIDMLHRYLILEPYIYAAMSACRNPLDILNRDEYKILVDVNKIMKPFKDVINELSGDQYPTCSIIIPLVRLLGIAISESNLNTKVGKSFKVMVETKMKERFSGLEKNLVLACSTVLDPRFKKNSNFNDALARVAAIKEIDNQLKYMKQEENKNREQTKRTEEKDTENLHQNVNQNHEINSIWNIHDKLFKEQQAQVISINTSGWEVELDTYLKSPSIPRQDNIFDFWKIQKHEHPQLSKIALRRLPNLTTALPSERLFSQAGLINTPNRSQLSVLQMKNILHFGEMI